MKKSKRIICFVAAIIIVAIACSLPCFAWEELPATPDGQIPYTHAFFFRPNDNLNVFSCVAYSTDGSNYEVFIDTRYINILNPNGALDNQRYYPLTLNISSETFARNIIIDYLIDTNSSRNPVGQYFNYNVNNALQQGIEIGYEDGYQDGFTDGSQEVFDTAYNEGYTDGATDSGYMKNTLITIFSSPYYILNEVFNFELLGVNVASVIMFILSIVLVGFVIKMII